MVQENIMISNESVEKAAKSSGLTEEQAKKFIAELKKESDKLSPKKIILNGIFC